MVVHSVSYEFNIYGIDAAAVPDRPYLAWRDWSIGDRFSEDRIDLYIDFKTKNTLYPDSSTGTLGTGIAWLEENIKNANGFQSVKNTWKLSGEHVYITAQNETEMTFAETIVYEGKARPIAIVDITYTTYNLTIKKPDETFAVQWSLASFNDSNELKYQYTTPDYLENDDGEPIARFKHWIITGAFNGKEEVHNTTIHPLWDAPFKRNVDNLGDLTAEAIYEYLNDPEPEPEPEPDPDPDPEPEPEPDPDPDPEPEPEPDPDPDPEPEPEPTPPTPIVNAYPFDVVICPDVSCGQCCEVQKQNGSWIPGFSVRSYFYPSMTSRFYLSAIPSSNWKFKHWQCNSNCSLDKVNFENGPLDGWSMVPSEHNHGVVVSAFFENAPNAPKKIQQQKLTIHVPYYAESFHIDGVGSTNAQLVEDSENPGTFELHESRFAEFTMSSQIDNIAWDGNIRKNDSNLSSRFDQFEIYQIKGDTSWETPEETKIARGTIQY